MGEKLIRSLLGRMATLEKEMFSHPPKTMEEFRERFGRYQELKLITDKAIEDAKGIEKD